MADYDRERARDNAARIAAREEIAALHRNETAKIPERREIDFEIVPLLNELEEVNKQFDEIGTRRNFLIERYAVLQEMHDARFKELTEFRNFLSPQKIHLMNPLITAE